MNSDSLNLIDGITKRIEDKKQVYSEATFWKIPRSNGKVDIKLKLGKYKHETDDFLFDEYRNERIPATNQSIISLENEGFLNLIKFIETHYEPFKHGIKNFISLDKSLDEDKISFIKALFSNPEKEKLLKFIADNNIIPQELVLGLQYANRLKAVKEFEEMLKKDLSENDWQKWFTKNSWVLGSNFVKILDEREIDTKNIADFLMEASDGFLDIIELKKPNSDAKFWMSQKDHDNYVPHSDLVKAITQSAIYIHKVEQQANSADFIKRVGVSVIKPRCLLIFGRSNDWNNEQKEAYRILNCSYHNLIIMTYDQVLERATRILDVKQ
ncbi:MAG: DUF4263 domain-containing protein [Pyrinomonadaceae bacterium]|nr:DUF4263 domain-containing protein [Pyrinomonadaceae bacterium]